MRPGCARSKPAGVRQISAGLGEDYWLYVVVNCKTQPELYLIQDPASKLNPKEEASVVRYMVGQDDWRQAADTPWTGRT
ncbi:MAG: hypothetical protein ACLP9L_05590 [Thermoguttaceae bacterium]